MPKKKQGNALTKMLPKEVAQHPGRRICSRRDPPRREGKHGAANTKQAIAIGLSKARRAGVNRQANSERVPPTEKRAAQDSRKGRSGAGSHPSPRR